MPEADSFRPFLERLEALGFDYMVTGSVATILYGEPRLTHDVDVVLRIPPEGVRRLADSFGEDRFYCPPIDVLMVEVRRPARAQFNLIDSSTGVKADVYLAGRDPLHAWGLEHRRRLSLEGLDVWIAPPEYVIVRKLEYYREGRSEKHLDDIAAVLEVQGEAIDRPRIEAEVASRGLQAGWAEALRRVTPPR